LLLRPRAMFILGVVTAGRDAVLRGGAIRFVWEKSIKN
jgi:hypothetical protein